MAAVTHIKKGDILVREGDVSNCMYWVQSGTLRLYKKKGNGFIELGVVHSGELVGEMSFLDKEPRSASVEALQPCDIVEIPQGKFDEFVASQPSWVKALMSTLVKRLRSTSNRVKELESSSIVYAKDEEGRTTKVHEFLSTADQLKLSSALLLAAARNGERSADGVLRVKSGWLQYFASQVMGLQLSKVQVFTDLMDGAKVLKIERKAEGAELAIFDLDRVEKFIYFAQDETTKMEEKQLPVTGKGVAILDAIADFGGVPPVGPGKETFDVNMDEVFRKTAAARGTKVPFEWSGFDELLKANLTGDIKTDANGKVTTVNVARFHKFQPVLSLRQRFRDLNIQKREG